MNMLGSFFLLLPIPILGDFGDFVLDKDVSIENQLKEVVANTDPPHFYDREGWEVVENDIVAEDIDGELLYDDIFEDNIGFHHISKTYSDNFIKSPKDKYAHHRTEHQTKEMISQHSSAQQPHNHHEYQYTNLISQDHLTSKPDRPLRESASFSDSYNSAPYAKYDKVQSTKHVPSQAPGILLFVIDLLDSALKSRRPKIRNRLDFGNNSTVKLGNRVTIDTVTAVQELMLKFLEWGAFIATDLLFQLFWPV